jgi:hypothetical protein
MGIFDRLNKRNLIDIMRLEIHMNFKIYVSTGCSQGTTFTEWIPLSDLYNPQIRPFLLSLLYARALVLQPETRSELFKIVDDISKANVRDDGQTGFDFKEWSYQLKGIKISMWPWVFVDSIDELGKHKTYHATMQSVVNERDSFVLNLHMDWGQDKVLVPASALIAINSYFKLGGQQECYELAILLWQINEYYKSVGHFRIGSDSIALKAAMKVIRSGGLVVPQLLSPVGLALMLSEKTRIMCR